MKIPARPLIERLPPAALGATLTAIAALFLSAQKVFLLPVLVGAVLLSYVFPARLEGSRLQRLFLRAVLIALIIFLNPGDPESAYDQFGPARQRNIFGLVCGMEAALQFWRPRGSGDAPRSLLTVLFMSGMVLLSASNTFDDRFIRWLTPVFLLFAAVAARDYRRRVPDRTRAGGRIRAGLLAAALVTAVGVGMGGHRVVIAYRGELMDWSNRLLFRDRFEFETSGMSRRPTLGPTFGLRGSAERVLRIADFAGDGHWRGVAWEVYDRGTWGPPMEGRKWQSGSADSLRSPRLAVRVPATHDVLVTRLVSNNPLLYAPLSSTSLDPGSVPSVAWAPQSGGPLRVRARAPYEYTVSIPENDKTQETFQGLLALPALKTSADRAPFLEVPDDEPEMAGVRALALHLAAGQTSDHKRIEAIVGHLISSHPYSLRWKPSQPNRDPVADFLLTPHAGAHCEFFAASATLLLRYAGVPARYVTGYYAHEGDGSAGVMVVRQQDAHAWCEAWVNGIGWVTVDATPGDGRPDGLHQKVEWWRKGYEWSQDRMQALSDFVANLTPEQVNIGLALFFAAALLYGLVWYLTRRRRQKARSDGDNGPRLYSSPPDITLADFARRFEAGWARQGGMAFPPQQTYSEHLSHLPPDAPLPPPEIAQQARVWAARYDRARFGGRFDDDTRRELVNFLNEWDSTTR